MSSVNNNSSEHMFLWKDLPSAATAAFSAITITAAMEAASNLASAFKEQGRISLGTNNEVAPTHIVSVHAKRAPLSEGEAAVKNLESTVKNRMDRLEKMAKNMQKYVDQTAGPSAASHFTDEAIKDINILLEDAVAAPQEYTTEDLGKVDLSSFVQPKKASLLSRIASAVANFFAAIKDTVLGTTRKAIKEIDGATEAVDRVRATEASLISGAAATA